MVSFNIRYKVVLTIFNFTDMAASSNLEERRPVPQDMRSGFLLRDVELSRTATASDKNNLNLELIRNRIETGSRIEGGGDERSYFGRYVMTYFQVSVYDL